jgi:hypothetical protein
MKPHHHHNEKNVGVAARKQGIALTAAISSQPVASRMQIMPRATPE